MISKKYIVILSLISVNVFLVSLTHSLATDFCTKNYITKKVGLSWGLLIHYTVTVFYPTTLIICSILIYTLKKRYFLAHLPIGLLLSYLLITHFPDRPYRTLLLILLILCSYIIFFGILLFLKKRSNE